VVYKPSASDLPQSVLDTPVRWVSREASERRVGFTAGG
jgi:hypothetical protein